MSISIYETRTMTRAVVQMKSPYTWLRDTIFGEVELHKSKYVDIDVQDGNRKVAAYVNPRMQGKNVTREGYTTNIYKAPYIKEKTTIDAADNDENRPVGINMYDGAQTPEEYAQRQLGKDLAMLNDRIDRAEELQAAQAIQTGVVTVSGDGIADSISFGMKATHLPTLAGTAKWDDLANSDPIADFRTWTDLIAQDSGLVARDAIVGRDAMKNLIRNTNVQNLLDNRRINSGEINPRLLPQNVRYHGYISDANVDLWEYTEWYYDSDTSQEELYIDPDKVVLWSRSARAVRHYGVIKDLKAGLNMAPRFAKSWEEEDPSARFLLLQSAPLLAPHQIDGFLCATVQ